MTDLSGQTILQVIPDLAAGGAERTTIEVAAAITAAGGRALVVSRGGRLEGQLENAGGRLFRLDVATKNPIALNANATRIARLIRDHNVTLVHARSRAPGWSALWAARRTKTPFVTTYHGAYNARSGLKRLYNSVMARGDRVIANSHWIAEHVHIEHGVPWDRIATIPRGVDLARFKPSAVVKERVRAARALMGIARSDPFVILLPARLTRWKGQVEAIEAIAMLPEPHRARVVVIMAGDPQGRDEYVSTLLKTADRLGLPRAIRIIGHLDDMPAAFMASDLVLTPSIEPEAFGRTAAEGAAMEKIVIAADHGGARETVIDGETGFRVTPGAASALSDAIRTVMEMPETERRAMEQAARAHVLQNYSTEALQEATLRVYHSLLEGPADKEPA